MRSRPLAGRLSSFAAVATAVVGALAALAPSAFAQAACPNADVRAQQRSEFLPDCRAYEVVSPTEKGGSAVDVGANVGITRPAVDGNAFVFASFGNFADAQGGMPMSYRARRLAGGWISEAVTPRPKHPNPDLFSGFSSQWQHTSSDLSVGYANTADSFDPTDIAVEPKWSMDIYRIGPGQQVELISRGNGAERTVERSSTNWAAVGATADKTQSAVSSDGRHAFFRTGSHLVPEDAGRSDGPDPITDLYDRVDGVTHLVNVDSDENLISPCGSELGDGKLAQGRAISTDGSRVVFMTPTRNRGGGGSSPGCADPSRVYVRVNNEDTVHVSASQRTDCATQDPCTGAPDPDPSGTQGVVYEGSSADGRYVFMSSYEALTDDATVLSGSHHEDGGLYRYDMETGDLELFQHGWGIERIIRVSADGSTVYFISYIDKAPGAVLGEYNLYARRGDEIKLIATTPDSQLENDLGAGTEEGARPAVATPDGDRFVFVSTPVLGSFDHAGRAGLYLYDFSEGELMCVSCDPGGQRPPGSTVSTNASIAGDHDRYPPLSVDGESVVFESGDRLVAQDVNTARDIYRYADGRLSLITTGRSRSNSLLVGATRDGDSVFFLTGDGLVGSDRDGNLDAYVARVDGGFLEAEVPVEAPCVGDGCQGATGSGPVVPLAGSLTFDGLGDLDPPATGRLSVARIGSVRGGVARLRVRVPGSGRISVSGQGVRGASRRTGRAAAYEVRVALNRKARNTLRSKGVVRSKVTVRFRSTGGRAVSRSLRLVFRASKDKARPGSRQASVSSISSREGR